MVIAAGIVGGSITESELQDMNLDEDILSQILVLVATLGGGGIASALTISLLNTNVGETICDTMDEYVVDPISDSDLVDDLNPFNW